MKARTAGHWTVVVAMVVAPTLHAQSPAPPSQASGTTTAAAAPAPAPFSQGELEAMVAPIALYPDALLSQMLMASTYPLDIVEAARWRKANPNLKEKALEDALQKQPWDASVKSLTAFPEVLDRMNQDLGWTQKLGDAFLGQQKQLLDAVQVLRQKAKASGHLDSNQQQTVKVETQESKQVIVIEPASPQVVYVPTYEPTVVYGGWGYPAYPPYYPPYWYPPVATPLVSGFFWGVGLAAAGALWGHVGWGHGDIDINVNRYNDFNRTNISNKNWQHDGNRRGAVPYRDQGSRDRYAARDRQAEQARDQFRGRDDGLGGKGLQDRQGLQQAQREGVGTNDRGGAGNRGAAGDRGGVGDRGGAGDRAGPAAGSRDAGAGGGQRDFGGAGAGRGGASAGSRDAGGAFGGGNGASTRAASSRGHSSMSSAGAGRGGGGGMSRGGGGGGGGGRGGGGRR